MSDCVDMMRAMGTRVVLLAFSAKGDLEGDKPGTDDLVRRLRDVANCEFLRGLFPAEA